MIVIVIRKYLFWIGGRFRHRGGVRHRKGNQKDHCKYQPVLLSDSYGIMSNDPYLSGHDPPTCCHCEASRSSAVEEIGRGAVGDHRRT